MNHQELLERFQQLEPVFKPDAKRAELASVQAGTASASLWDDPEEAVRLTSRQSVLEQQLEQWDELTTFLPLAAEDPEALKQLEQQLEQVERQSLLSGPHDQAAALLTIHAGTGGVDAQDFAEMLERMFLRFVEQGATEAPSDRPFGLSRKNWKAEVIDRSRGEEAGIKHSTVRISGSWAYGLLQSEAGVHRLVRLSPFNSKNLRQTSFALVEVVPEIERESDVAIAEDEVRIDVFRAGGHGGQGVNTTDSAVRITHIPTGLVVSVQNERSQHQNKATAFKILKSRLARLQELQNAEEAAILKGEFKEGSWGNQIRSYVLQPYQMVKDHRTNEETSAVQAVLDGELKPFVEAYLLNFRR